MSGRLLAVGFALLLAAPVAGAYHGQDGRAGLVVDGVIGLEGALAAYAQPGAALYEGDGDLALALDAGDVRVTVTETRPPRGAVDHLLDPDPEPATETWTAEAARLHVLARLHGANLLLFTHQGLASLRLETTSASLAAQSARTLAPTAEARDAGADRLDFRWTLPGDGLRLDARESVLTATGDFSLYAFGLHLAVEDGNGDTRTLRTGADGDTVRHAVLELKNARLRILSEGTLRGFHAEALRLDLNGTARLPDARGHATVGDDAPPVDGPTTLEGVLRADARPAGSTGLTRFQATGDVAALQVAGSTRDYGPPAATAAGAGALLALATALAAYSRIRGPRALEHGARRRLHELARSRGGVTAQEAAHELDLSWTTAKYHLDVLQREGILAAADRGRERVYHPVDRPRRERAARDAARSETAAAILRAVERADEGGLPAGDLAQAAGVSASTASWHLRRLVDAGLLTRERRWRRVYYAAAPSGR